MFNFEAAGVFAAAEYLHACKSSERFLYNVDVLAHGGKIVAAAMAMSSVRTEHPVSLATTSAEPVSPFVS